MMTEQLDGRRHTPSSGWIGAFAAVPREKFVPEFTIRAAGGKFRYEAGRPDWLTTAYQDASLVTQSDPADTATSSSTAPTVMARMLEATRARDGDTHPRGGHRHRVQRRPAVPPARLRPCRVHRRRPRTSSTPPGPGSASRGYTPRLVAGNGMAGCTPRAPYNRLVATCGVGRVPDAWRDAGAPGQGRWSLRSGTESPRLTVRPDHSARGHFLPDLTAFMKARATPDTDQHPGRAGTPAQLATLTGRSRTIELPTGLDADVPQALGSLAHPDVTPDQPD